MRYFLFYCIFLPFFGFSQIGFTGSYFSQQVPDWKKVVWGDLEANKFLTTGLAFGLDYKITPFENLRIELLPELQGSQSKTASSELINFTQSNLDFNLKTQIYFLSLEADCDCPTFSRDASILKKGLFFQIAPGYSYLKSEINSGAIASTNSTTFKMAVGLGLDIGLSDLIDITPYIQYHRYFNSEWKDLQGIMNLINPDIEHIGSNKSNVNRLMAGVRVGFRFK